MYWHGIDEPRMVWHEMGWNGISGIEIGMSDGMACGMEWHGRASQGMSYHGRVWNVIRRGLGRYLIHSMEDGGIERHGGVKSYVA